MVSRVFTVLNRLALVGPNACLSADEHARIMGKSTLLREWLAVVQQDIGCR